MITLGNNIKKLRKESNYSQMELASLLGVSQTSIAHYEAGTRQPSIETLRELSNIFAKPVDDLLGHLVNEKLDSNDDLNKNEIIDLLISLLLKKEKSLFFDLFVKEVVSRFSLSSIIDDILKEVMYKIGDMWEQGLITEVDEHFAHNLVRKAVHSITPNYTSKIKNKTAISFTIGSEKHSLGMEMINLLLESKGINTLYIGSIVTISSVEQLIRDIKPDYICISVTMDENINTLLYFLDKTSLDNTKILIGGQGVKNLELQGKHNNVVIIKDVKDINSHLS